MEYLHPLSQQSCQGHGAKTRPKKVDQFDIIRSFSMLRCYEGLCFIGDLNLCDVIKQQKVFIISIN